MPSFFTFQQGTESRALRASQDASPLLGRFRAVPGAGAPGRRRQSLLGKRDSILASIGGSVGYGYGTLFGSNQDDEDAVDGGEDGNDNGRIIRSLKDLWIQPKQGAVRRVVERWWGRWGMLIILPAAIVSLITRIPLMDCWNQTRRSS